MGAFTVAPPACGPLGAQTGERPVETVEKLHGRGHFSDTEVSPE
jgi:hypothetical protein